MCQRTLLGRPISFRGATMRIILPITDHREMAVVRRAQKYSLLTGNVRYCVQTRHPVDGFKRQPTSRTRTYGAESYVLA